MLNPFISFTVLQEKVNFTHDPTNVLRFCSHRTICWAICSCPVTMPLLVSVALDSHVFEGCFGVLGRYRPWKRLTSFKSSWGMLFFCYFISVLVSAFSGCKRQGMLVWLWGNPGMLWHLSVSVYRVAVVHPNISVSIKYLIVWDGM